MEVLTMCLVVILSSAVPPLTAAALGYLALKFLGSED
jgi:hypothetical protein